MMADFFDRVLPLTWTLTGLIFYLAGWLMSRFPPKQINWLYGYRTPRSMQSIEAWQFAQKKSAVLMKKSGAALLAAGILSYFIPNMPVAVELALAIVGILTAAFIPIYFTEKALKAHFK